MSVLDRSRWTCLHRHPLWTIFGLEILVVMAREGIEDLFAVPSLDSQYGMVINPRDSHLLSNTNRTWISLRVYLIFKRKWLHLPLFRSHHPLDPRSFDLSTSTSTSRDVDDAQNQQRSSPSFQVEDSRPTMASAMNNDPPANRHSTGLLFEAPKTPHDHY